jgi:hypothetical protein
MMAVDPDADLLADVEAEQPAYTWRARIELLEKRVGVLWAKHRDTVRLEEYQEKRVERVRRLIALVAACLGVLTTLWTVWNSL